MCVRIIIGLIATLASFTKVNAADFTIPVVDLNEFYNPNTKQQFIEEVSKALHETGFFAVINTRVDQKILDAAYASSQQFFTQSLEKKNEIYAPALNGQRGYVPGETAQGHTEKDFKEFVHIGKKKQSLAYIDGLADTYDPTHGTSRFAWRNLAAGNGSCHGRR